MKYILAVCIFAFSSQALAEEIVRESGDTSLSFGIDGAVVNNFQFGIGGKYWLSHDTALRGSLQLRNSESNTSPTAGVVTPVNPNPTIPINPSSKIKTKENGISLGYEKHFPQASQVSPYIGAEVAYFKGSTSYSFFTPDEQKYQSYVINMLLGVEYFLNTNVSLGAEYTLGYLRTKYTSGPNKNTFKSYGINSGQLALSFYY